VVKDLLLDMNSFQEVCLELQKADITLSDARGLLDILIQQDPNLELYLGTNARIVKDPNFERGIVKILKRKEGDLTPGETAAVSMFHKISTEAPIDA